MSASSILPGLRGREVRDRGTSKAKNAAVLIDQGQAYAVGLADEFKQLRETRRQDRDGAEVQAGPRTSPPSHDSSAPLPDVIYIPWLLHRRRQRIRRHANSITARSGATAGLLESREESPRTIDGVLLHQSLPDQKDARAGVHQGSGRYKGAHADGLAALGDDAAKILFDAMKRAKTLDGRDLRNAIADTKKFPGVTGEITINSNRGATKAAVVVEMAGDPAETALCHDGEARLTAFEDRASQARRKRGRWAFCRESRSFDHRMICPRAFESGKFAMAIDPNLYEQVTGRSRPTNAAAAGKQPHPTPQSPEQEIKSRCACRRWIGGRNPRPVVGTNHRRDRGLVGVRVHDRDAGRDRGLADPLVLVRGVQATQRFTTGRRGGSACPRGLGAKSARAWLRTTRSV